MEKKARKKRVRMPDQIVAEWTEGMLRQEIDRYVEVRCGNVIDATEPLLVHMDSTETGVPTMDIGGDKQVFTRATGKGRNRSWHFAPLSTMKPIGGKQ